MYELRLSGLVPTLPRRPTPVDQIFWPSCDLLVCTIGEVPNLGKLKQQGSPIFKQKSLGNILEASDNEQSRWEGFFPGRGVIAYVQRLHLCGLNQDYITFNFNILSRSP